MSNTKPKRAKPTSLRLTQYADELLTKLAEKHGVSKASIIEMAIREKAERDGISN